MTKTIENPTLPIPYSNKSNSTSESDRYISQDMIEFADGEHTFNLPTNIGTQFLELSNFKVITRRKKVLRDQATKIKQQRILRNWEGYVRKIFEDSFEAVLTDMECQRESELVEIGFDEVSPADLELLQEGAIFYFTIFQRVLPSIRTITEIRFKRTAKLDETDVLAIKREAKEMFEFFKDE